jgi:hypothetical protein
MVSPPTTSEAGAHAAGDTKSEHFELGGVGKLNEKHFNIAPQNTLTASCCCRPVIDMTQ